MLEFNQSPNIALYKRQLANSFGIAQQLEFDFGKPYTTASDVSGDMLAVLLHGAPNQRLTNSSTLPIGGLSLAIPDDTYSNWLARWDLSELAIHGISGVQKANATRAIVQELNRDIPLQVDAARPTLKIKEADFIRDKNA